MLYYIFEIFGMRTNILILGLQTLKCYFGGSCGYEGAVIEEEKSQPTVPTII